MVDIRIDSKNKKITATVLPSGELDPIEIRIGNYEIIDDEKGGIRFSNIEVSRDWINQLINLTNPNPFIEIKHMNLLKTFL